MSLGSWLKRPFRADGGRVEAPDAAREHARGGTRLLEAGRVAEALKAFRAAVAAAPNDAAHHVNLAYAMQQAAQPRDALVHLKRAVELDEANFDARYMLGAALEQDGDAAGAARQFEAAIALRPEFEPAHAELCRALAAADETAKAQAAIERALALNPSNPDFHLYHGNLLLQQRRSSEAAASFRQALVLRPHGAEAHGNLGVALQALRDHEGAVASFERSLELAPRQPQVRINLAASRRAQGRFEEAAAMLRAVIADDPANAEAINQLGSVQKEMGQLDDAVASYQLAIELEPEQPGGYGNLGLVLYEQGRIAEAVAMYRRGLAIKPLATIHDNLGNALTRQGIVDEAIENYRAALELDPDNLDTRCNLAGALADGQGAAAGVAAFREILALKPDHVVARSNLLFNLCYDGETSPEAYLAEARQINEMFTPEPLPARAADPDAGVGRPLRVGLLSGDLHGHPVGFFIEGIVRHLGRQRFTLHAYSTSLTEDALTARIKPHFTSWWQTRGRPDREVAEHIRDDGIDILVDLAGHSALNALSVFAWRPAPVQLTWLGYFASTGVNAMDYVLADPVCVPPGHEGQFSERVWRMPHTRLCYTPPAEAPPVVPLPALANGHLTFGCFQRLPKITNRVLVLWARVLHAIPDARLLLQSQQFARQRYVDEILDRLSSVGVAPERVIVRKPTQRDGYLKAYGDVDVVLDTFPFTGGTTTCEALWMGVPTLTLAGNTMLGLQGAALLGAAGLPQWVAADEDEYVDRAVALTADRQALAELRSALRERVRLSPLFDTALFARHLESALLGMWEQARQR